MSSICSSFDPSGHIFASVTPALDVHKISIYNISQSSPIVQHTLGRGISVQCLKWLSLVKNQPKKKRKRDSIGSKPSSIEDLLLVLGTNKGSLLLFSPSNGTISTLSEGHSLPIKSVSTGNGSVWSCDSSGVICEWNIVKKNLIRSFKSSPDFIDINAIYPFIDNNFLLSSTNCYVIDLSNNQSTKLLKSSIVKSFPGFVSPISDILLSSKKQDSFLCTSNNERNINLFSVGGDKPVKIFIAQSNVETVVLNEDESALAVVTDDGLIELFINPLDDSSSNNQPKRKSKGPNSIKSSFQVRISRPAPSKDLVKVDSIVFNQNHLTVTWLENASIPTFENIPWKDETNNTPLKGLVELKRSRKIPGDESLSKSSGTDASAPINYSESRTTITSGKDVKHLDSEDSDDNDDDNDNEYDEQSLADRLDALNTSTSATTTTSTTTTSSSKKSSKKLNGSAKSTTEVTTTPTNLDFSTPGSFSVILNQALKTNDKALLESCLTNHDENMIKISVQKLDSTLAVQFLERLAEKLAHSPTRAGQLNIWIKWVMISHGGYLVTLPNLLKTLSSLHSTVSERVSTLPRLLALQGRLELLYSQMEIRRDLVAESRKFEQSADNEEDEADVEYIEEGDHYIMNGEEDVEELDDDDSDEELDDDTLSTFTNGKLKDDFDEDIIMDDNETYSDVEAKETILNAPEEDDDFDDEEIEQIITKPKKSNGRIRR